MGCCLSWLAGHWKTVKDIFTMTWHFKICTDIENHEFSRHSQYRVRILFIMLTTLVIEIMSVSFWNLCTPLCTFRVAGEQQKPNTYWLVSSHALRWEESSGARLTFPTSYCLPCSLLDPFCYRELTTSIPAGLYLWICI